MGELNEADVTRYLLKNPSFLENWEARELSQNQRLNKYMNKTNIDFVEFLINSLQNNITLQRKDSAQILRTNEMFKEAMRVVTSELNAAVLCHNLLQHLCMLLPCERASLFLAQGAGNSKYLVSYLFDISANSTFQKAYCTEENVIHISYNKGILGYVAKNKLPLIVNDVNYDIRFLNTIDKKTDFQTKNIICIPILDKYQNLLGVAELLNKGKDFCDKDEQMCVSVLSFCSLSISNFLLFHNSFEEYKRHKLLLKLIQCTLEHQKSIPELMDTIMKLAIYMLKCKNISVFLIDKEKSDLKPTTTSKVYQLLEEANEITKEIIGEDIKYAIEENIASGNTFDVICFTYYDEKPESETKKWLVCLPVMDPNGKYLGWMVYVRNSVDIIDTNDLNMMETFTKFFGLGIYNSRLHKHAENEMAQWEFTNDILCHRIVCEKSQLDYFLGTKIESESYYKIRKLEFNDNHYSDIDTVFLVMRMFLNVDTLSVLNIHIELLYRWVLTVKKNYRPVTYHNWRHAVNAAQSMYFMLTEGNVKIYFTEFEVVILLLASLCHDIDHRGTTNTFHARIGSPLNRLHSTSTLEHHHVDYFNRLLQINSTNIFKNISSDLYKHGLRLIELAIISTDLAVHFKRRPLFKEKMESENKSFESAEEIDLLISMLMTAADLSAITRPWEIQKRIAITVAAEFFEQSDIENKYNYIVSPMMDRSNRHNLPKMQVDFIDFVCYVVYKGLSDVSDTLKPLYVGMIENRMYWSKISSGVEKFDVDKELQLIVNNISFPSDALTPFDIIGKDDFTQTYITCFTSTQNNQTILQVPIDSPEENKPVIGIGVQTFCGRWQCAIVAKSTEFGPPDSRNRTHQELLDENRIRRKGSMSQTMLSYEGQETPQSQVVIPPSPVENTTSPLLEQKKSNMDIPKLPDNYQRKKVDRKQTLNKELEKQKKKKFGFCPIL
ncbi:cGMP-specific 3',5'-cyclic phosphodiesterase-like [Argonauta hians]